MSKLINILTNGYVVLGLLVVYLFMAIVIMNMAQKRIFNAAGKEIKVLDLEMSYSGETAYQLLEDLGEEGRSAYKLTEMREDIAYPITYCLFLISCTLYFIKKSFPQEPKLLLLAVFPIFTALFDLAENTSIIMMIHNYPEVNLSLGNYSGKMTLLKWGFAFLSIILAISATFYYLLKRFVFKKIL